MLRRAFHATMEFGHVSFMHTILFDIDGTLVSKRNTETIEKERFRRAVYDLVGRSPSIEPWLYDGMVDPEICRRLLIQAGLSEDLAATCLHKVIDRVGEIYLKMEKHPVPGEGVIDLLRILKSSSNLRLGVLTGNLSIVAEEKLRLTGIRTFFDETFYSDGYFKREDLVRDALRSCMGKHELLWSVAVTIVGDTPRDMEAANANGANAIGVASGFYSLEQLTYAGANVVFSNLVPTDALLKALGVEID